MEIVVTKEFVQNLKVGDIIPNVFGKLKPITQIFHKGVSEKDGKWFACFYQEFSQDSTMSHSIREGQSI